MSVNGMLKKSRYYPSMLDARGMNIDYYPIDPDSIAYDSYDGIKLLEPTRKAIKFVQERSESEKVEYTIVLYGEQRLSEAVLSDYVFERGKSNSATYSPLQIEHVITTKRKKTGKVIYGHTHVSNKRFYNSYSIRDLKFIIEKAISYNDDAYGLLITKDSVSCIKYDIRHQEFFKVKIS